MTADDSTSLFITYQTPVVLSPVILKLTLQRRTCEQRPCSHLVDAFVKAARPSILKAAAFSQGRAPRVEDVARREGSDARAAPRRRDGVRHLLYRGGDAVPAEDVGLKLAPYRLGPGVPELALSVDGKVDPLPE